MPTTIRLDPEIEERYSKLADRTGRSKSFYIREALVESIDRLEHDYDILADVEAYRKGKLKTYTAEEVACELGLDAQVCS